MKRRGSALIIAMMLIASIGVVAFGISRLIFANSNITNIYENGTVAYYAAESGIEEGFLRYRFNRNEEIPKNQTIGPAYNKVFRTNLSTKKVFSATINAGIPSTTDLSTNDVGAADQAYDLHMGYLGTFGNPWYANDADLANKPNETIDAADQFHSNFASGDYSFLTIPKDETRKFDLTEMYPLGNSLKLYFKFSNPSDSDPNPSGPNIDWSNKDLACKAMAEVIFDVKDGIISKTYKILTVYDKDKCNGKVSEIANQKLFSADSSFWAAGGYTGFSESVFSTGGTGQYYAYSMSSDLFSKVLMQAGDPVNTTKYNQITMSVKPLFYNADVFFLSDTCSQRSSLDTCRLDRKYLPAGPYTYITSTGYYGGVTKKLSANIDRQSGTLYDLYDYVIFKGR